MVSKLEQNLVQINGQTYLNYKICLKLPDTKIKFEYLF